MMKIDLVLLVFVLLPQFYCIQLFGVQQDIDQSDSEELVIERRNSVNPVILVPGLGGSRLEFKSKSGSSSKYDTLWLALWDSAFYPSYVKNVSVLFNESSNQFQSQPDLDVRPLDFGGVDGISIIAPALPIPSESGYYDKLVSSLQKAGYTVRQNLFGIPFDFRIMNPQQLVKSGVYEQVKRIVEKAYIMNGNKRVHFIAHSEGCTFVHNFITSYVNDKSWNDKYISALNLVSAPFGGAVTALAFLTGPKKWVVPWLSAEKTHDMVKNFAGIYWMQPNDNSFASQIVATVEIVSEKNTNKDEIDTNEQLNNKEEASSTTYSISVSNMTWLFDSTGRQEQSAALKYMQSFVNQPPKAPGIKVNLHYGFGLPTLQRIDYKGKALNQTNSNKQDKQHNKQSNQFNINDDNNNQQNEQMNKGLDYWWMTDGKEINGEGDGTVNLQSLKVLQKWKQEQKEEVTWIEYPKQEHFSIIRNEKVILNLIDTVTKDE